MCLYYFKIRPKKFGFLFKANEGIVNTQILHIEHKIWFYVIKIIEIRLISGIWNSREVLEMTFLLLLND